MAGLVVAFGYPNLWLRRLGMARPDPWARWRQLL